MARGGDVRRSGATCPRRRARRTGTARTRGVRRAGSSADDVERMEEDGDRLDLRGASGRLAVPQLVEAPHGHAVQHARDDGRHRRRAMPGAKANGSACGRIGAQGVERRVVAAGEHRATEAGPCATRSIHATEYRYRGRVASIRRAARRGSRCARCRPDSRLVSIGSSGTVASRMTPVSPMPPTVAQNSSGRSGDPRPEPSASSTSSPRACRTSRRRDGSCRGCRWRWRRPR